MQQITWKSLEDSVRSIASIKWKSTAAPRHLGGVNFDAVLEPSTDELILIEVTKRGDLEKIRDDIVKINTLRIQKIAEGVLVKGYVLIEGEPTTSMVETGNLNKVKVLSVNDFYNDFFQYDAYVRIRHTHSFGSALNPLTGKPDTVDYVPVRYQTDDYSESFDVEKIAEKILGGERLILVGDYGTGKSRCIQKVFETLTTKAGHSKKLVLAINLRDHWGATSASSIISGHLEELGLSGSIDNAMQIVRTGGAILLLDGVDEVGAQVFGVNKDSRKSIRKMALDGVRKLIQLVSGGVLLTGRSHYFDSDEEMIEALGLSVGRSPSILRCPEEFSDDETKKYLEQIQLNINAPTWLPRKPLVFQVLSTIDKSIATKLLETDDGEFTFWSRFITTVSEREAKIHGSLEAEAVKRILMNLAEISRESDHFLGRLSVRNVREAYERVIQDTPDYAGEQMLARLCTLARVAPASPERQFVDGYIVDGLRAEALLHGIDNQSGIVGGKIWRQPLTRFGWELLYNSLSTLDKEGLYRAALTNAANIRNFQAYAEILSALIAKEGGAIDLQGVTLECCDIFRLIIGKRQLLNLKIRNSYIQQLEIFPESASDSSRMEVEDCIICDLHGVSSETGLPKWIRNTTIEKYESLSTASRIKNSDLDPAHALFLVVVHKIFFQHGAGREEKSLLKGGFGQKYDAKLLYKILNILLREKLIEKHNGREGPIYGPIRKHTRRMAAIKGQLALSNDPLWGEVGKLH